MKRIALIALTAAACGGRYKAPPAQSSIALLTGKALKPYDATKPGDANPQGLAQSGGTVYATLSNQRIDPASGYPVVAGPGFLVGFVPSTGKQTLIDLGGSDEQQCQNPGVVREASGKLYVTCSGDFSGADVGRALVEVDPGTGLMTRRAAIPDGLVPTGLAVGPSKIWIGDSNSQTVFSVDRATFVADAPAKALTLTCPQPPKTFPYVPDLAVLFGDLYALCATSSGGGLFRFDATTGALKGQVAVGPSPTELTATGDGRIAVINSADSTLSLVTINGATLTSDNKAVTFPDGTLYLQDVRARDNYLYAVASGSNSAQKIDLAAKGGPKIVQAASFPNGSNPYNIFPLDDDQAIVTDRQTNAISAAQWVNVP